MMLARSPTSFTLFGRRWASSLPPHKGAVTIRTSKVVPPTTLKPALSAPKPKVEFPHHLPKDWKYSNRLLNPALLSSVREEYKKKIVSEKPEPLWSRVVHFLNLTACSVLLAYMLIFMDMGPHWHIMTPTRDWFDNWWAQHWYISSRKRKKLEEERARQDEKLREQERLLDEKIAARRRRERSGELQVA